MPKSEDNPSVKLSLLLTDTGREPDGMSRLVEQLRELGIKPTTSGKATLSAVIDKADLVTKLGAKLYEVPAKGMSEQDMGASAGFACDEPISVPEPIKQYIVKIEVVPPFMRML